MNITRPTLLLDESKMMANLDRMMAKAKAMETELVPHFKTHQSKEIGEMYRAKGVDKIMVSSVKMAEYFAANGWQNITIAFPFNPLEIPVINSLVADGASLTLLVSERKTIERLAAEMTGPVNLMLEMDAGYGRSGVKADDFERIKSLVDLIESSSLLNLYGLYSHPGNTYQADSIDQIKTIWAKAITMIEKVKAELKIPDLVVRIGDTPGCSVVEDMDGVDEIAPGNFIFYDLVMNYLDVCDEADIAVAVACPVVSKDPENLRIILHGGGVHFSKDHLFDAQEQKFFGEMVIIEESGWSSIIPKAKLVSLSQEHGTLQVDQETFDEIEIGDVVGVLPIHSCLTANLLKSYLTFEGNRYEHLEKVF